MATEQDVLEALRRGLITDDIARQKIEEFRGAPPAPLAEAPVSPITAGPQDATATQSTGGGVADAFTKGVTFGLGPLITAGESALLGRQPGAGTFDIGNFEGTLGSRFDEALAAEREQNQQFREDRPVLSGTAEVGGSIASLLAAPGVALTKLGGKTLAGKTVAAGAEGAVIGAGFAAGEGRDIEEGAFMGAAFGAAGPTLQKGVQAVGGGIANFARGSELLAKSPTLQQLRAKTTRLYRQAKNSQVRFKQNEFANFAQGLDARIRSEGARPKLTDKTIAVLKEITDVAGEAPDFQTMDELRRIAQIAASANEPAERRLGAMIIESIDDFVETGSSSLGATAKEARTLWGRVRRDELVASSIERAKQNVSGLDQGLRVEFRKILNNPKKLRGFAPDEIAAMKGIVKGTNTANTLRAIGKLGFNPTKSVPNIVGGGLGAAGGAAVGGLPGVVAVQGAGIGSRIAADALQRRNAQVLGAMVRAGKSQAQISKAAKALERIGGNERAFQGLVRTLGVTGASNAG